MGYTKYKNETEAIKGALDFLEIPYREKPGDRIVIGEIIYKCVTGKWYDPIADKKGIGLNSFLNYIKDNKVI